MNLGREKRATHAPLQHMRRLVVCVGGMLADEDFGGVTVHVDDVQAGGYL